MTGKRGAEQSAVRRSSIRLPDQHSEANVFCLAQYHLAPIGNTHRSTKTSFFSSLLGELVRI
jgi:hypothetical protein